MARFPTRMTEYFNLVHQNSQARSNLVAINHIPNWLLWQQSPFTPKTRICWWSFGWKKPR